MDVYFYTGRLHHPLFAEAVQHPPDGVCYLPSTPKLLGEEIKRDYKLMGTWWYRAGRRLKEKILDSPLFALLGIPQIRYIKIPRCDLVHSRHVLLNRFPWVVEVEEVTSFTWYRRKVLQKSWARKALEQRLSSPYCRMILPWTEASRSSLENGLDCTVFRHKIRVVYPAIAPAQFDKNGRSGKRDVHFLFVGSGGRFYGKGGMETLLAFDQLNKKYPEVSLTTVGFVPPSVRERFARNPKITFLAGIPTRQLRTEFAQADVFVLPSHLDTINFVYLEAFAHGIPCIGAECFSAPEVITDGLTGFLVRADHSYYGPDFLPLYDSGSQFHWNPFFEKLKEPSASYVNSLVEKMAILVEDPRLRLSMSHAAYEEVLDGKFSIPRRKKILKEIYEECLAGCSQASNVSPTIAS